MNMAALAQVVEATLSFDPNIRKPAEQQVTQMQHQPGFGSVCLELVAKLDSPDKAPVRQAAAIFLKNFVKKFWKPEEGKENMSVSQDDRTLIKSQIVEMMCHTPNQIQSQLSECVNLVAKHDFPKNWDNLLPTLVAKMKTNDFNVITGVLVTANSIFKRFRYTFKTDELFLELKYCLGLFCQPLLDLMNAVGGQVGQMQDLAMLKNILDAARLACRIFYSLNWQDIPEFFEDNMDHFMNHFLTLLRYDNATLDAEMDGDTKPSVLEDVQSAIVENIMVYTEKYEEEFKKHLSTFTAAIWDRLMKTGIEERHDKLATSSIKFLTSLASNQYYNDLFAGDQILTNMCEKIVVPNVIVRESDEELFEDNPTDFIRRDIEGSDSSTRRKCSIDLMRALCKHGGEREKKVSEICFNFMQTMIQQYGADRTKWALKDSTVALVIALAARKYSAQGGVVELNPNINLVEFFTTQVVPELQSANVNEFPMLKADGLKFVAVFRNQITLEMLAQLQIFPTLVKHLHAESTVQLTYAADALWHFFSLKDPANPAELKIKKEVVQPFLQPILEAMVGAMQRPNFAENEYITRMLAQLLHSAGPAMLPIAGKVLEFLLSLLAKACSNQEAQGFVNALYGHYLFECMAVIITHAAKSGDANMITQIQNTLFDPCRQIMAIESLSPYALQLMTQMLDLQPHESGIPAPFQPLFVELTKVPMWENHGNIPALVRLLQVYLKKAGADALVGQQLQPVLGIVNKLICSRSTEGYSFELLNCVVTKLPRNLTDPFMQGIMNLVFQRLMSGKTQRFIAETIQFLCIYIGKHDLATIIRSIEGIQAGAFGNFTTQMWVPNLQNIVGNQQKKHCVIGMTKFLHDSQIVSQPALWCDVVEATVTMLEGVKDDAAVATAAAERATLVTDDDMSYHGGFSPLKFTNHTPLVFFPEIQSSGTIRGLKCHFAKFIQEVSSSNPQLLDGISDGCKAKLQEYFQQLQQPH